MRRSSSASRSPVWHCQTVIAPQPELRNARRSLLSFRQFFCSFGSQNSRRVFGGRPMRHPWACQKQPLTKMTFCRDGKTMSGVPGKSRRCKRNLYPREWRTRRTVTSGAVSLPRMRDINALLLSGDRLSAMMQNSIPSKQAGSMVHYYPCSNRQQPNCTASEERAARVGVSARFGCDGI